MNKSEAEQIARVLGQYHDAFAFLAEAFLSGNQDQTVKDILAKLKLGPNAALSVFGFAAVAFIFSNDCVAKSLKCAERLIASRSLNTLGVIQNDIDTGKGESAQGACLRHLRNCFAHGRFQLRLRGKTLWVSMRDQNAAGKQTFEADCKAEQVIRVAEKTLIKAYKIVAARAT